MSLIEGKSSFHSVGSARLVEEGRELAWAETHVQKAPDLKWILGSYVQASTEESQRPNANGHVFPYEDLKTSIKGIPHRPLNLLHAPGRRVGVFTAAEFVYPEGTEQAVSPEPPIIEALAAYWSYYEPELLASLEMAHSEGALFFSMEAVPKQITCKGKGEYAGCNETFNYRGRNDPSYCDHLNLPSSRKILHKPMFTAGALIIPPSKPGWANANVKEISQFVETHLAEAELAYDQIAEEFPHLDSKSWETMMTWFIMATEEN